MSDAEEELEGEGGGDDGAARSLSHYTASSSTAALGAQDGTPESIGADSKAKKKKKLKLPQIRINLTNCKYEVLRIIQRKLGWREVGEEEDWEVYWTDTSVGIERIMKLSCTQKINHFNGMLEICRKKSMARNLMKMQKAMPEHFDFFPRTFIMPNDLGDLVADVKARGKKQIYIFKPDAGCQGRGIRLVQGGKEELVHKTLKEMDTMNVVAQHYLPKPYLINGYKFDLRIYALVLSCDPLRLFIFREGLVRLCTELYSAPKASNLNVAYMHLTNYAVNKHNENFVAAATAAVEEGNAEDASKWSLAQLQEYIAAQGRNWSRVWSDIQDLIIKTVISIQPILRNNYRSVLPPDNDGFSCFEILGYDVMLDTELRPWLIEVNHSPSFNVDSPLDLAIKEDLITDTMKLVRIDPKLIMRAKKAEKRAAAGRLLGPLQKKKQQAALAAAMAEEVDPSKKTLGLLAGSKPKTPEEYEAWRADVLLKRGKYEAKHSGGFTRMYPSNDATKQALYEEMLRAAVDVFNSGFQPKAFKIRANELSAAAAAADDKRKKDDDGGGAGTSDEARARQLAAKQQRDKMAQQAVARRNQANSNGSSNMPAWRPGGAPQAVAAAAVANGAGAAGAHGPREGAAALTEERLIAIAGMQPRAEYFGEVEGSVCSSRPASARSMSGTNGEPVTYYRVGKGGLRQARGLPPSKANSLGVPPAGRLSRSPPGSGDQLYSGTMADIMAAASMMRPLPRQSSMTSPAAGQLYCSGTAGRPASRETGPAGNSSSSSSSYPYVIDPQYTPGAGQEQQAAAAAPHQFPGVPRINLFNLATTGNSNGAAGSGSPALSHRPLSGFSSLLDKLQPSHGDTGRPTNPSPHSKAAGGTQFLYPPAALNSPGMSVSGAVRISRSNTPVTLIDGLEQVSLEEGWAGALQYMHVPRPLSAGRRPGSRGASGTDSHGLVGTALRAASYSALHSQPHNGYHSRPTSGTAPLPPNSPARSAAAGATNSRPASATQTGARLVSGRSNSPGNAAAAAAVLNGLRSRVGSATSHQSARRDSGGTAAAGQRTASGASSSAPSDDEDDERDGGGANTHRSRAAALAVATLRPAATYPYSVSGAGGTGGGAASNPYIFTAASGPPSPALASSSHPSPTSMSSAYGQISGGPDGLVTRIAAAKRDAAVAKGGGVSHRSALQPQQGLGYGLSIGGLAVVTSQRPMMAAAGSRRVAGLAGHQSRNET